MKYALLIYGEEPQDTGARHPLFQEHMALAADLAQSGVMTAGAGLKPTSTATTVRKAGAGHTVHDGPFAEIKEQLGGFYVVDVADLDAALAVAKRVPLLEGGSVEVRPLIDQG